MTHSRFPFLLVSITLALSLALLSACGRQTDMPAAPEPTNTPVVSATPAVETTPTDEVVVSETPVAPTEISPGFNLEGVQWQAQLLVVNGALAPVLPEVDVTLAFKKGDVSGNAGCNNYFGQYMLDNDNLTITAVGATLMACEPSERMQQEAAYLAMLGAVASYEFSADGAQRLTLRDASGHALAVYMAIEPAPLAETKWKAASYNNGKEAIVSILAGSEIAALFGIDGSLTGNAGCNDYMTTYTVDGNAITIAPAATTRMMCSEPEGVMDQEFAYLQALTRAATFEIEGGTLTLLDATGARVAEFGIASASAASEAEAPGVSSTPAPTDQVQTEAKSSNTETPDLTNTSWKWMQTSVPSDGVTRVRTPRRYTIAFLPDGKLKLRVDCNQGAGVYAIDGANLKIEAATTTRKACPPRSLADRFLADLNRAATYTLADGGQANSNLIITLQANGGEMKFAPFGN